MMIAGFWEAFNSESRWWVTNHLGMDVKLLGKVVGLLVSQSQPFRVQ
jgi:hypothetical protein